MSRGSCCALLAALALLVATTAPADEPPAPSFAESVDVELVTVPFYAVDAEGQPVFDLKPHEIDLRMEGRSVALDSFDRYGADSPSRLERSGLPGAGTEAQGEEAGRLLPSSRPRHVFLLFDQAFLTARGLDASRRLARDVLPSLPAHDWLYLLRYHTQEGFQQEIGPVRASEENKAVLLARTDELKPNVERVRLQADLQPIARGRREGGNVDAAYVDIHQIERANYRAEASAMCDALDTLAVFLRQVKGPKLVLYFSQGVDSALFEEGDGDRVSPLRTRYDRTMKALGESGAMMLFLNGVTHTEAGFDESTRFHHEAEAQLVNNLGRGDSALQEMAEVSGGKVLAHTNLKTLGERLTSWVSAYYEVGYYPPAGLPRTGSSAVEIRVTRPGVEVWAPRWAKARRPFTELTDREKQFVVTDLVLRGPVSDAAREIDSWQLKRLDGQFSSEAAAGKLAFDLTWPRELRLLLVELYTVVLETGAEPGDFKLLSFGRNAHSPRADSERFEAVVDAQGPVVWGLVVVDPTTGALYLRRYRREPLAMATAQAPGS